MSIREASHAGSWYTSSKQQLSTQLDGWLAQVPSSTKPIGPQSSSSNAVELPSPGCRAIIAPHAGYSYSGPAAAWAYKALDLSKAKRVFLLGPSHHFYLTRCALSQCEEYETSLGNLRLDKDTISALHQTGKFDKMSLSVDEDEHSLEMHLPYIYKLLSNAFPTPSAFPPLIPILIGNTSPSSETTYGRLLAPYLADTSSIFIISSDFAHWGSRFRYTYYEPGAAFPNTPPVSLRSSNRSAPKERPIHESIKEVDFRCMGAVERGAKEGFWEVLESTGNTVCGRHPIGVFLAAVEAVEAGRGGGEGGKEGGEGEAEAEAEWKGRMRFVRYERSGEVMNVKESSVSYASAFAVF
ncbi:UPF0103-domain-containing protein [Viridothelium virens]|uniref:UPF0103-domain-containing protein n=1 Tax=Viridothelium virens TaxID=1048519 RepID=A0A6A6HCR4_VIRVR|nr:UPF0103-domain-containing protein [Viridothelium virens]